MSARTELDTLMTQIGEVSPDLVITQSAETFEKTTRGIQPLAKALQDSTVQVSDMEKLAALGEFFPM